MVGTVIINFYKSARYISDREKALEDVVVRVTTLEHDTITKEVYELRQSELRAQLESKLSPLVHLTSDITEIKQNMKEVTGFLMKLAIKLKITAD